MHTYLTEQRQLKPVTAYYTIWRSESLHYNIMCIEINTFHKPVLPV